jgi:hypothetical protein
MSETDLRPLFPLNDAEFPLGKEHWVCHLIEVSDQRPDVNRLSWFLAFHPNNVGRNNTDTRKLEIVTNATEVLETGWPADLRGKLESWLTTGEDDGRLVFARD